MAHKTVEFVVKHLVVGAGAVGLAVGARLSREVISTTRSIALKILILIHEFEYYTYKLFYSISAFLIIKILNYYYLILIVY
jgi:hypothetical protein